MADKPLKYADFQLVIETHAASEIIPKPIIRIMRQGVLTICLSTPLRLRFLARFVKAHPPDVGGIGNGGVAYFAWRTHPAQRPEEK